MHLEDSHQGVRRPACHLWNNVTRRSSKILLCDQARILMRQDYTRLGAELESVQCAQEAGESRGRCIAFLVGQAAEVHRPTRQISIDRVTVRGCRRVTSGLKVSWYRQRQFIRRERKKGDLPFEFFPMLSMLGTSEDELVVDQVRARVPPLSDQMGGSNGKPGILFFDLPPIRLHYVISLTLSKIFVH